MKGKLKQLSRNEGVGVENNEIMYEKVGLL